MTGAAIALLELRVRVQVGPGRTDEYVELSTAPTQAGKPASSVKENP